VVSIEGVFVATIPIASCGVLRFFSASGSRCIPVLRVWVSFSKRPERPQEKVRTMACTQSGIAIA